MKIDRSTFCVLPFTSLTINPTGYATPCCKFNRVNNGEAQESIVNSSIDELFNQEQFKRIREKFISGIKPIECKLCWAEEDAGILSLRESINELYTDNEIDALIEKPTIQIYDLKFTNLCNIKCRMCDSHFSSSWIPETLALKILPLDTVNQHKEHSKQKFVKNSLHLDEFRTQIKNLRKISFSGGEPLIQPEHELLMSEIEKIDEPLKLVLSYNTNGTIYDEKVLNVWKKMAFVDVSFSIDGTESQFEFLRHGAKWDEVVENIKRYKQNASTTIQFYTYITVNAYNIFYLDRIIDFSLLNKIPVRFNFLHFPNFMSVQILYGTHLEEKVKTYVSSLMQRYKHNPFCESMHQLESFVEKLSQNKLQTELIKKFLNVTRRHDDYRKENTFSVFPILAELEEYDR